MYNVVQWPAVVLHGYRPELERCYHFTKFAIELNEPEAGVAPTDSRNRPDQRLMEEGSWDEANRVKVLLEEKQRAAARQLLAASAGNHIITVSTSRVWGYRCGSPTAIQA